MQRLIKVIRKEVQGFWPDPLRFLFAFKHWQATQQRLDLCPISSPGHVNMYTETSSSCVFLLCSCNAGDSVLHVDYNNVRVDIGSGQPGSHSLLAHIIILYGLCPFMKCEPKCKYPQSFSHTICPCYSFLERFICCQSVNLWRTCGNTKVEIC